MKIYNRSNKIYSLILLLAGLGMVTGCLPEEASSDGNGLTSPNLEASFTVTPVTGKTNTYALKADENGLLGLKWDKGEGGGSAMGKAIDTVFYPDAGKYTITMTALGKGSSQKTTSKEVVVATSDPIAGNLVVGGKFDAGDESKWKYFTYSAGVTFAVGGGKMVATGGNWGHGGIYQAIQVTGGKKYKIDMNISGSGATDTWFEVYAGTAVPGTGDYNSGGMRLGLNTWNGCGKTSFNGLLSSVSCAGTGAGVVEFTQSGTIYLVIRGGGADFGTAGISIDNVSFRGTK